MSKYLKKVFDLFPSYDIPREREDELIEKITQTIFKMELELPALLLGHVLIPLGPILSQTVFVPIPPLLELIGISSYEYFALLSNREALKRLVDRIEQLKAKR